MYQGYGSSGTANGTPAEKEGPSTSPMDSMEWILPCCISSPLSIQFFEIEKAARPGFSCPDGRLVVTIILHVVRSTIPSVI